jgi:hypothetical protein
MYTLLNVTNGLLFNILPHMLEKEVV